MKLNKLEQLVLERLLASEELREDIAGVEWSNVQVFDRTFTGVGFMTDLGRQSLLRVFPDEVSLRWGKDVGAHIGGNSIDAGFVVYVDDGFITAVEGYTYGDDWPSELGDVTLYEIHG